MGDLDQQRSGDGRWNIEWHPVQCPVGSSKFVFGFQSAGNLWYSKLQVSCNTLKPLYQLPWLLLLCAHVQHRLQTTVAAAACWRLWAL